jgi:hypothetical protein
MPKNRPEEPIAHKGGQPVSAERTVFPWPWGIVAIAVMALAWVGLYLLWNGLAFLFGW